MYPTVLVSVVVVEDEVSRVDAPADAEPVEVEGDGRARGDAQRDRG